MYKRQQEYIANLQQYNSKLQNDLSAVEEDRKRVETEKASMAENLGMYRGQLQVSRVRFYYFYNFVIDSVKFH